MPSLPCPSTLFFKPSLAQTLYQIKFPQPVKVYIGDPINIPSPTQSPDTIANWKTYRSEKYGFEFKYPEKYIRDSSEEPFTAFIEETPNYISVNSRQKNDGWTFTVIHINLEKKQFNKFDNLNNCDIDKHPGTYLGIVPCTTETPRIVTVGGKKANGLTIQVADTFDSYFIQTKEKPFIEISTGGYAAPRELFDQILSTFKFLGEAIDTSDWKIYRNEDLGVEFKHPPHYSPKEETRNSYTYVVFTGSNQESLEVSKQEYAYELIPECPAMAYDDQLCIIDSSKTITVNLDRAQAQSFYLREGIVQKDYRIVQLDKMLPDIVLKMDLSGKNTDETLEALIRTFKFVDKIVGEGEYCWGRTNRVCSSELLCKQPEQSAADAPGICVK